MRNKQQKIRQLHRTFRKRYFGTTPSFIRDKNEKKKKKKHNENLLISHLKKAGDGTVGGTERHFYES